LRSNKAGSCGSGNGEAPVHGCLDRRSHRFIAVAASDLDTDHGAPGNLRHAHLAVQAGLRARGPDPGPFDARGDLRDVLGHQAAGARRRHALLGGDLGIEVRLPLHTLCFRLSLLARQLFLRGLLLCSLLLLRFFLGSLFLRGLLLCGLLLGCLLCREVLHALRLRCTLPDDSLLRLALVGFTLLGFALRRFAFLALSFLFHRRINRAPRLPVWARGRRSWRGWRSRPSHRSPAALHGVVARGHR
jgi:hypothetical protein